MKLAIAAWLFAALVPAMCFAQAESGKTLYDERCSTCHGGNGQGSSVAPSLIGRPASDIHLMLDTGRMPAAAPYVNEIHKSPAFTQQQMTEITNYVLSFSMHADRSLPLVMAGDVNHGRALFAENCAHCHGATGHGASVGAENVAPSLMHASVFQVAEAIRAGPQIMPRFGSDVLSDQDVDDIAHYVNYMQTQADQPQGMNAGGFAMSGVGPVAEGFAAWFFGLGALVLFVRRIGSVD